MVQYRLDGSEAVYAQHSGAERCPSSELERRGGRPVVYLANGSHAAYFHAGTRDRMWPDPNDEADGRGAVQRPRAVTISAGSPAWMRYPGPGAARGRAGSRPSSPPRSARPSRPRAAGATPRLGTRGAAVHGSALRRAGACDGAETALAGGALALVALLGGALAWRRRQRVNDVG